MTNEELQAIALSMLERQREKVHQQRESLLNPIHQAKTIGA